MSVGEVHFVGAGPGDPSLITLRGERLLRRADTIVLDSILPAGFLSELGITEKGKEIRHLRPGDSRDNEEEVVRFLCREAHAGRKVVRLKAGDPFVFARFDREIELLSAEGIPWDVVPGPTSATAALTASGFPPTRRGNGRSFAVVSAREAGGAVNGSYPQADTLIILMGVGALRQVTARLLADGWPPETPTAVLEKATMPWERRLEGELSRIADEARKADIEPPAILVVGAGARRPPGIAGRPVILFTGLDTTRFRTLGLLLHWPALKTVPHEGGLRRLPAVVRSLRAGSLDWTIFTSPASARAFFRGIYALGLDSRVLARTRLAVTGPGTNEELFRFGVAADALPSRTDGAGLAGLFQGPPPSRLLLVQGRQASPALARMLRSSGHSVTRLSLHDVIRNPDLGRPLPEHDVIYFTSPSGVRAYLEAYGEEAFRRDVWCIGQTTLAALERLKVKVRVVNPHVPHNENEEAEAH